MKLKFTDHLKKRLSERKIPLEIIQEIFRNKGELYYDNLRKHQIMVSKVTYRNKLRKMLVAYDIIKRVVEVITLHPITDEEIKQRLKIKRWSYEKN